MRTPHILIVDDDPQIRSGLSRFLIDQGLRVSTAADGSELFEKIGAAQIDLILLDIMMPGEDGLSLCRHILAQGPIPIVLLTAVTGETDRIVGLEIGADDYVCKPFNPRELLARMRAILRRSQDVRGGAARIRPVRFAFLGWVLDVNKRTLTSPEGALVEITSGEFDLLQAFVEHPQQVLNRDQLLDLARGRSSVVFDRSIDVQVMRLRRKIEADPQTPEIIKTVRNGGYLFTPSVTAEEGRS